MKLQEVRESALALPLRSRKKLIQELARSVLSEEDSGGENSAKQSESEQIEAAWKTEIKQRSEAYKRGEVKTVPGEKVMAWLRKRMK